MKAGTFIGGLIGLIGGCVFVYYSNKTHVSQLDAPPFLIVIFAVMGGALGGIIHDAIKD